MKFINFLTLNGTRDNLLYLVGWIDQPIIICIKDNINVLNKFDLFP